jgi:glucose-1-phosphate adenylyltransferase
MNDTLIEDGAVLDHVIVDKEVVIGRDAQVGGADDNTSNQRQPQRLNTGITLIGKRTRVPARICIGRNVEIGPDLNESSFPQDGVSSGATIT